jgi:hypothetical protein
LQPNNPFASLELLKGVTVTVSDEL